MLSKKKKKGLKMLQPVRTKYRKAFKGRIHGKASRAVKLNYGQFGLKAMEPERIIGKQIESARQAITRKINRKGKLWIRVFPDLPITLKPIEVRMGKGEGSVSFWSSRVAGGTIIFELCGVTKTTALTAFRTGGAKLPIKTQIVM